MSVFQREGGWAAKFVIKGRQHWVRGGPWATREAAEEAERKFRHALVIGFDEARREALRNAPHTVYRLFAGDELVYVGITVGGLRRLSEHTRRVEWWSEVERATFEHFDGFDAARREELRLIRKYRPRHNKSGLPEPIPESMVGADAIAKLLKFTPHTIRNWATEGLLPVAGRTPRGQPYFDLDAVEQWCIEGKANRPLPPKEEAWRQKTGNNPVAARAPRP